MPDTLFSPTTGPINPLLPFLPFRVSNREAEPAPQKGENTMFTLSWYEEFIVQAAIGLLTLLKSKLKTGGTITLSWWETFIAQAGSSLLALLATKIKNPLEQEGIQAAASFLHALLSGEAPAPAGIDSAIQFLQKLLAGQVSIT